MIKTPERQQARHPDAFAREREGFYAARGRDPANEILVKIRE
jgi:hypothetical protein